MLRPIKAPKKDKIREKVIALRKENLSIYDIRHVLIFGAEDVHATRCFQNIAPSVEAPVQVTLADGQVGSRAVVFTRQQVPAPAPVWDA